jgi:MoxR-like ATPase
MFLISVDYPEFDEEVRIARETTGGGLASIEHVITGEEVLKFQDVVRRVPVPDHVYEYVVKLVRMSRPTLDDAADWIKNWVMWGAGPRAVQYLVLGAKAHAVLNGNYLVQLEDVDAIAEPVLSHRILTNFHAESEGIGSSDIIERIISETRQSLA